MSEVIPPRLRVVQVSRDVLRISNRWGTAYLDLGGGLDLLNDRYDKYPALIATVGYREQRPPDAIPEHYKLEPSADVHVSERFYNIYIRSMTRAQYRERVASAYKAVMNRILVHPQVLIVLPNGLHRSSTVSLSNFNDDEAMIARALGIGIGPVQHKQHQTRMDSRRRVRSWKQT